MFDKTADQIMAGFTKVITQLEGVATKADVALERAAEEIERAEVVIDGALVEKAKANKFIKNLKGLME